MNLYLRTRLIYVVRQVSFEMKMFAVLLDLFKYPLFFFFSHVYICNRRWRFTVNIYERVVQSLARAVAISMKKILRNDYSLHITNYEALLNDANSAVVLNFLFGVASWASAGCLFGVACSSFIKYFSSLAKNYR